MTGNSAENPMRQPRTMEAARAAPRCGARTRSGAACRQPGMANGRCRMHGGASTGPRTADGVERIRAARTIHGAYNAEARELRDIVRALKAKRRAEVV